MEEVDREISEMKLSLNRRARTVAESYLIAVCVPFVQTDFRSRGDLVWLLELLMTVSGRTGMYHSDGPCVTHANQQSKTVTINAHEGDELCYKYVITQFDRDKV